MGNEDNPAKGQLPPTGPTFKGQFNRQLSGNHTRPS